ncbi:MAG TPA: hypothetical protein PLS86_12510 [Phycisphaerae bacterium]|nr:hypothetical protein [Phycisphaerae bacterium]HQA45155.1 hypothetical protein [Phycisphaerae bacterium]
MGMKGNDRGARGDAKPRPDADIFGEDILHDLEELLQNEPTTARKKPAPSASPRPPAPPVPVPPPKLKGDAEKRRQAQELAAQAGNASDPKTATRLARQALELDRSCADALVVLAHARATAPDELAEGLARAVAWAAQGLGKEHIDYYRGKLWSVPEARPYMRARRELADVLRDMGRVDQAIAHYEALLELDAGDSQRNREPLLSCYLALGYHEAAKRLLDRFAKDESAVLAWSRVLERYLAGDLANATTALAKARESNHWVEGYLAGRKPMPQYTLSNPEPGSDSEARHCAAHLLPALVEHPRFGVWLAAQQQKTDSK